MAMEVVAAMVLGVQGVVRTWSVSGCLVLIPILCIPQPRAVMSRRGKPNMPRGSWIFERRPGRDIFSPSVEKVYGRRFLVIYK